VAVRGRHWIGVGFAEVSRRWVSFNEAQAEAERIMPAIATLDPSAEPGFEVTLAGWEDGPRVTRLVYSNGEVSRYEHAPGVYLAPSLGVLDLSPDLSNEGLVKIATVQQTLTRKHGLNLCVGGDIELTTVWAEGVTVEKIGEYPDKTMMAERMARATPAMLELAAA
jgi:hypothetical protein